MKNNVLQKPLLNSAAVLVFFLAMLSASIANPEVTGFGALWLVILIFLRALQWLIGMMLAVLLCLALLITFFFGAIAIAQWLGIANQETLARMHTGFRQALGDFLKNLLAPFTTCKKDISLCER